MFSHEILQKISSNIRQADFLGVIADETSDLSNVEQVSILMRYCEEIALSVYEEFIGFIYTASTTCESLAHLIKDTLLRMRLNINMLTSQGYDGSSSIFSKRVGVSTRIRELVPMAWYLHCSGQVINLVLGDAVRNTHAVSDSFDAVASVSVFAKGSPKRQASLESIT